MGEYINWNGKIIDRAAFYISPDNRSFRYGDGFFETMKVNELSVYLEQLHFQRFFQSLDLLQFDIPELYTPSYFYEQIQLLLSKNNHTSLARVRLMIYRGDGAVYDNKNNFPNFIIQSWSLNKQVNQLNTEGLHIDIYKDARKVCDKFSLVKSNNYLSYLMAAFYVTKNNLNDAVILNPYDRIADSTIANIFIIQDGVIKTPPLTEGCINGVYRKYLLQLLRKDSLPYVEEPVTINELLTASEVFLTNAINGIRWISKCGKSSYKNEISAYLHSKYSN